MKILVIIDSLEIGGAEKMAVNIANTYASKGEDVFFCVTRNEGPLKFKINSKVKYLFLNKNQNSFFFYFKQLNQLIVNNKINVVHAHSSSILICSICKLFNIQLKLIWHDHLGNRKKAGIINFFYIFSSILFDAVICVNNDLQKWANKWLFVKQESIIIFNNFPLFENLTSYKKTYAINREITIVVVANGRHPKDHLTVVKALNILKNNKPNYHFKVMFIGLFLNDEYSKTLKSLITELGLNNQIFFAGQVDNPEKYLLNSDLGILSSFSEGLPVSLLEYGFFGLPVIASDVGQCSEVLENGKCGKLVKPGCEFEMSKSMLFLIENENIRLNYGSNFRKRVLEKYSSEAFYQQFNRLLKVI